MSPGRLTRALCLLEFDFRQLGRLHRMLGTPLCVHHWDRHRGNRQGPYRDRHHRENHREEVTADVRH